MSPLTKYILIPAVAPLAVAVLYFTPLSVIGCSTRGLLALAVVFISLVAGIVVGVIGVRARMSGASVSGWRVAAMCVLALPAVLILGPLG
jgi:hypothetical protein